MLQKDLTSLSERKLKISKFVMTKLKLEFNVNLRIN